MTKKVVIFLIIIINSIYSTGCSTLDVVYLVNNTKKRIVVTYEIDKRYPGPVSSIPALYKLDSDGDISSYSAIKTKPGYPRATYVKITLPPKTALAFAFFINERYRSFDAEYINDQKFNLKKMEIKGENINLKITRKNFDNYFKRIDGYVQYRLK